MICRVPPIATVVEAVGPVEATIGAFVRLTTDRDSAPFWDVNKNPAGIDKEKLMLGARLVTSSWAGLPLSGPTK